MHSIKRLPLFFLLAVLSGCGPSAKEVVADKHIKELEAQNAALEKKLGDLFNFSKTNESKLQELQKDLAAQTEQNKKLEQTHIVDAQMEVRKKNQEAIAAFSKIISATQVGINRHDYSLLVIDTKSNYEAFRPSLPESIRQHLDSALEHLLSANQSWDILSGADRLAVQDLLSKDWGNARKEVQAAQQ